MRQWQITFTIDDEAGNVEFKSENLNNSKFTVTEKYGLLELLKLKIYDHNKEEA
jgi:hypothetical protein